MITLQMLHDCICEWRADLDARLGRMEASLRKLTDAQPVKDVYTVAEFAALVDREQYTVREWARLGRIHAEKALGGRGDRPEWRITHREYLRYQAEGLLPAAPPPPPPPDAPPRGPLPRRGPKPGPPKGPRRDTPSIPFDDSDEGKQAG